MQHEVTSRRDSAAANSGGCRAFAQSATLGITPRVDGKEGVAASSPAEGSSETRRKTAGFVVEYGRPSFAQ